MGVFWMKRRAALLLLAQKVLNHRECYDRLEHRVERQSSGAIAGGKLEKLIGHQDDISSFSGLKATDTNIKLVANSLGSRRQRRLWASFCMVP